MYEDEVLRHARIWRHQRRPLVTLPWPASVQDFRRRLFVAEPSLLRVAVLPARVLRSVRSALAHVHACEGAALTRLCGRAAHVVQGGLPQCRHEGPQNYDQFLDTTSPRVVLSVKMGRAWREAGARSE